LKFFVKQSLGIGTGENGVHGTSVSGGGEGKNTL
jgi:hypothetical protein